MAIASLSEVPVQFYITTFAITAFVLGAVVGSFLNVCIYRLPRDLSVNKPKRSFCPNCKNQIPWYRNLPLVSWLALRGKCADCGLSIPFRYFGVELLTACLFLAVWQTQPLTHVFPYWVLMSLLVTATFIDFEHFIIPDSITWGGVGAGVVCSLLLPQIMGQDSRLLGLLWSVIGAAAGYFTLWGVVEAGKLAFGKKQIKLEKTEPFFWIRTGEDAHITIGDEKMGWDEIFSRESDQLILRCEGIEIDGKAANLDSLTFHFNRVLASGDLAETDLMEINRIDGKVNSVVIPREAMGFGDVKFIACIGAFLGWQAVFFTIFSASIVGAVVGVACILSGRREWSAKIPFGPYLALGAVIWIFYGLQMINWYLNLLRPPAVF